ncbi:winged helix-turn-helix domain-containing protein [Bradyrhizobium lablabi]|uniref:ATP-binding protein n=1 Tax=Bradyrhizobium lablabi TaxID=722472 RepID=UPI001BAD88F8|nr:winged helix-turn-helix domain-containing protein [Bradyrhizobium lablabi]MBR1120951.1 winged helix-turn-helix domain-containing protein [Bradyrhizobium lablabi]
MLQRSDELDVFQFGPFRLVVSKRLLLKDNEPVAIGSRAFDILIALVERAGEVVSHKELVTRAWPDVVVEETSLRVHMAGLRRALGDGREGARYITNVPGRGYCFVGSVQRSAPDSMPAAAPAWSIQGETLPVRLLRMVGRNETIDALRAQVTFQRFVSIVGPGGVGKTTVAIAVAHEIAAEFGNAICFVDLGALKNGVLVVPAVASAIGCLEQVQESLPRLLAFAADKRVLLVLDSCEHVIDSVAALAEGLCREAPLVHIIATSRESLRVEGEHVHLLQALDTPSGEASLSAASALASPAVQLFMDRAAAGGYRLGLSDEDAPLVSEICRQLDGMPLAIELTASRTSTYGINGLAQLIGDRLMLAWQKRLGAPRHQTLQAMLDWSYDLLSEDEQAVLCALSIFVGAFELEMAQAIASDMDRDACSIIGAIASLIDKSLISVNRSERDNIYRLLDTTRTYAAAKLTERGEADAVARRHALHFAERLAAVRAPVRRDRDLTAHARQIGDIRAALEWSFSDTGDASVGVALASGAVPLLLGMSMLRECRHWCLETMNALSGEHLGTRLELSLLLSLATASNHGHSDSTEVGSALERGLALADSLGDTEYQLEFLAGLNLFRTRLADHGAALAAAERYAATAGELRGDHEIVTAQWMLGATHHLIGSQALAQHSYENGFRRAATAGVSKVHSFGYDHQVRALIGYARTLWLRGFADQASEIARQGIEVAERLGHPVSLCICLMYATPVFIWRGDYQTAEQLIDRLIAQASRYSLTMYQAGGLGLRGEAMLARGETSAGVESLRVALSTVQTEQRYILSTTLSRALAEGLAATGHPAEAIMIIDAAVDGAGRGSGTFELPDLLRARAAVQLAASRENWRSAEASLTASLDCARRQAAPGWELRAAIALARLWTDLERADEARSLLFEVRSRFTEGYETTDLRQTEHLLHTLGVR